MTDAELIEQILASPAESRTLEFKRLGQSRNEAVDRTLQSIVAMANTDGGVLILGVDDPEKTHLKGLDRVFGIEESLELFDELGRSVKKILPPIPSVWPPVLIEVPEKARRIAILGVPKAYDHFRTIENHVYVRLEKGNKLLSPQEIVHFSYVKGFRRADMETVNVDPTLLKTSYYDAWRRKRGIADEELLEVLKKTGLAHKTEAGDWQPCRAAVLLFAEFPSDLMDTKCTVRVFQFSGDVIEERGETLNLVGAPKTISGPVIRQIADASEYVLTLLRNGLRVPSGFVTIYQIPERAVREAITNAVIHRDYGTKRDVEIRLFDDRLEVESPGLFPFNITPANIGIERAHGYRNDLLVKHLREFPDPPNLDQNEGVRLMRSTMREGNLYPPVFFTYPLLQDAVRVVLLNEKAPGEWERVQPLFERQKYVGNADVRKVLHNEDTVAVSKLLAGWVKQGLLVKVEPRAGAKSLTRYLLPGAEEADLFSNAKGK